MSLTKEEVARLAALSRLCLAEEEMEKMRHELDRVLEYVDRLQKIDTEHVPETGTRPKEFLREDVALPADEAARSLIISNFPDRVGNALQVPAVFEDPKK
ncbi:MAG TPA: Asp-tRNA(Asn)/Glu-tRNA(Gln) amidotransferase subunit GatC [Patescibacteria group bacterium]|nr:Asp-tRNA(Asn)/Glu-tRNA(Gln) amidotransferase subunit GatC [Patescibacteria group bacterium]